LPFSGLGAAEPTPRFYADATAATRSALQRHVDGGRLGMILVSVMDRNGNGDGLGAECCADNVVRSAESCLVDHDSWRN
jgi:hypothetical protein